MSPPRPRAILHPPPADDETREAPTLRGALPHALLLDGRTDKYPWVKQPGARVSILGGQVVAIEPKEGDSSEVQVRTAQGISRLSIRAPCGLPSLAEGPLTIRVEGTEDATRSLEDVAIYGRAGTPIFGLFNTRKRSAMMSGFELAVGPVHQEWPPGSDPTLRPVHYVHVRYRGQTGYLPSVTWRSMDTPQGKWLLAGSAYAAGPDGTPPAEISFAYRLVSATTAPPQAESVEAQIAAARKLYDLARAVSDAVAAQVPVAGLNVAVSGRALLVTGRLAREADRARVHAVVRGALAEHAATMRVEDGLTVG